MVRWRIPWSIGKLMVVLLAVVLAFGTMASAASAQSSSATQKHQQQQDCSDLICHTTNASECYPRVFQATNQFQRVHEDQDLPPGLHVRLNVWTGEKEAKINNESEDGPPSLAGLPVDQSVVLVDQPETVEDQIAVPKGAPAYDPVGLVKKPEGGANSGNEAQAFMEAVATLKNVAVGQTGKVSVAEAERERLAGALEQLDEFAHDMYYGLKLMEDEDATRSLLCLMSGGQEAEILSVSTTPKQAAVVVGAALQNNPAALHEVEKAWARHKEAACTTRLARVDAPNTLASVVFGPYLAAKQADGSASAADPAWIRARLSAVNGLIKSDAVVQDFLARDGLTEALRVIADLEGPEYETTRVRAAQVVLDNFLDQDMGADVSRWPVVEKLAECDSNVHAGCWDHHIQQQAAQKPADEIWQQMLQQMQNRRDEAAVHRAAGMPEVQHREL